MSPSRIRYVTACQQLLALGVVLAALAPAAAVVSLDVISEAPTAGPTGLLTPGPAGGPATTPAPTSATGRPADRSADPSVRSASLATATVPATTVEPTVTEIPLTERASSASTGEAEPAPGLRERPSTTPSLRSEVLSDPEPVTGYGAIGVTWEAGTEVAEDDIDVQVRTRTGGAWSGWSPMEYDDEHGPDAGSAEAATARPGTDEALVGHVDDVQVKVATADGALPADLSLAVIDPGAAPALAEQAPELEAAAAEAPGPGSDPGTSGATDALTLRAARAAVVPPAIYSRAQWGADEKLRSQSAPSYGTVQGGFVHHTVNANTYSADEVPGIIRSIYAYHVTSRGWRDVGYNFLVDRFGRVWEGRYGGVDKAVVGAHTSGYNDNAFAMSAIGNFETVQPPAEMLQAYGTLFAWKLSLSGVSASATNVRIGSTTFPSSIMGHRDAGQTACPGRYLYAQIPAIRSMAASAQAGMSLGPPWTGRDVSSQLVGSAYPDVVLRRAADGRGVLLATGGLTRFGAPVTLSRGWKSARRIMLTPDITGDARSDLVVVGSSLVPKVRAGNSSGRFGKTRTVGAALEGHSLLTPVGDVDHDGRNDLVGRAANGSLHVFLGKGKRGFTQKTAQGSWKGYNLLVGAGDVTGDGRADVMARSRSGKLYLFAGNAKGTLGKRRLVSKGWSRYDTIVGGGDYDNNGRADLVVRRAKTGEVFVRPGQGGTAFGPALGPVARLKGKDWLSGGPVGTGGPADLVVRAGNKLQRLDNTGTTELSASLETNLDLSGATRVVNAGDFDRDGTGDVIVRDAAGTLLLRPGAGNGTFGDAVSIGTGFGAVDQLTVVADRNGDGLSDLVGTPQGGTTTLWPGRGRSPLLGAQSGATYALAPAGTDLSPYDLVVPVSDANGDGIPDLLVRRAGTGSIYLLTGATKALGAPRFLGAQMEGYDLAG